MSSKQRIASLEKALIDLLKAVDAYKRAYTHETNHRLLSACIDAKKTLQGVE